MQQIIQNFASMGRRRLLLMGGAVIAIVAALFLGLGAAMQPTYRPLTTDLTASEAAPMMSTLEQGGFSPRISADGTMISLPEGDIARARMALAEAGLPAAGNAGWELFDNASGIGMNSFLQRINRLRALEGELARSIQTMDGVEAARVHIVLPERETFSQERPDPSASVIVRTRRGAALDRRQALAIRNLVAPAVPDMSPEDVVVLSASGEVILGQEDMNSGGGIASTRAGIEDRISRNIENILSAHVGAGNVRVRVAADISTERQVVVQESFDPEQQVARSTSALSEEDQSTDAGAGNVDVANNMPGVENGGGAGGGGSQARSKTLDETDYEIGSTRSERVIEPGSIRRLTVAVLVNGRLDGETYVDRTPEELDRLAGLVRSAAGIDTERGDEVTVDSLRFAADEGFLDAEGGGVGDFLGRNSGSLIRAATVIISLAMIMFLALRLMRRVREPAAAAADPAGGRTEEVPAGAAAEDVSSTLPAGAPAGPGGEVVTTGPVEGEEYVPIRSVSGNVMKKHIDELSSLVDSNPEEALRVIRSWIRQKG